MHSKALFSAGVFAWSAHDLAYSQALLTQSVALSREVGGRRQLVLALGSLGVTLCQHRQEQQAADAVEESVALARATDEPALLAYALLHVLLRVTSGMAIGSAEERSRAKAAGEEALRLYQVVGDRMSIAMVQLLLGNSRSMQATTSMREPHSSPVSPCSVRWACGRRLPTYWSGWRM